MPRQRIGQCWTGAGGPTWLERIAGAETMSEGFVGDAGRVTAALVWAAVTSAGLACGRDYPAKNTQTDLIAFSHIDKAWADSKGAGVTVAVVDWQFDAHAAAAANFVSATSLVPGERMGDLKPWHGAWMVDIVHRIAPEAKIIPIIGRSVKQAGYQDSVLLGIRYAAEHGAAVITSSMGPVRRSEALRDAIDFAESHGTLFVNVHPENVAADAGAFKPCSARECDPRIVRAGIVSVPEHPVKPDPARLVYTWPYSLDTTYQDDWGFSMGPPIVGGAIALMKAVNPALSPHQLRDLLAQTADLRDGFRVLNAEAAVKAAMAAR
jgi:serine protease